MKRFIKNILMFVVIISTLTLFINFLYGRSYNVDPNTNKFSRIPDTIQICNFGSSHGLYGFNYEELEDEYDCFNFALEAQSLSYDYRLFQYYGDHIVEGSVVFIPVSYFSLFGVSENNSDNVSKEKRYYSILPETLIKGYDYQTGLYVKYLPALASSTNDFVLTLIGKNPDDRKWQWIATDILVNTHVSDRVYSFVGKKDFYDDDGNRIENQEEIDALCALIRGCQEKGAIPILITTPFPQQFTEAVKETAEDFYEHFYSIIDWIVEETSAEYYDYAFDERFANKYSWFVDTDHLNKEGARNFTNIVMEEIVYAKGYLNKLD